MILVDTSVWVDHLRAGDPVLVDLLESGQVIVHAFVIGELALGGLGNRDTVTGALRDLPRAVMASDDEVLGFIDGESLAGLGIGYVDAHLLASARLTGDTWLWTRDKRLDSAAARLALAVSPAGSG